MQVSSPYSCFTPVGIFSSRYIEVFGTNTSCTRREPTRKVDKLPLDLYLKACKSYIYFIRIPCCRLLGASCTE